MTAGPVPVPQTLTTRLARVLDEAPPRRRLALEAGIKRLAVHPRQRLGDWRYLELCASYIHTMVDTAYETARQAWRTLRGVLGWWSVPRERIEALGGSLRPLVGGQRHGQHLLIADEMADEIRDAAETLGLYTPTPDELIDWRDIEPLQRGSALVCRCPFHDDRRPSMLLDPQRHRATCLACRTTHRLDASRWRISAPRSVLQTPAPSFVQSPSTMGYQSPGDPDRWVISTKGIRGMTTATSDGDLLDALVEADAKTPKTARPMLGLTSMPLRIAPDRFAFVDRMVPTGWLVREGRYRPKGHRAIETRYVLVDIDDIDLPNVLDARDGLMLAAAGARLETWARAQAALSGVVAVVQTSLHGVQVVFELAEPRDPLWRREPDAGALHDIADAAVLVELDAAGYIGGHADETARGIGRLMRRPGLRVDKRRQPWVARLRYISNRGASC